MLLQLHHADWHTSQLQTIEHGPVLARACTCKDHAYSGPLEAILDRYNHCQRQCIEARSADFSTRSAVKFFHLHFSLLWIGSHSTFVLCTALLTAEYAEGARAQSECQQHPEAL